MRLKVYRAPSIPQAMALVRAELGPEALILNTRRWYEGVELTAALEPARTAGAPDRGHAEALAFHAVPDRLRGALSFGNLADRLDRALAFGRLPLGGRPLLLTGPPGAGKTLSVVRLATRLTMAGQPPTIITTDDAKAGANEQLLAFTRMLDLPLTEANDPSTLARTLAKRRNGAAVLIDTPGTDPFDPVQSGRLRGLASSAGASIALVLPAGLDPNEAADLARAFADAGATFLVATRLDIARRLGGILAAADAARLPLTEAGIGPGAADGLVPLTPAFLAERLLRTGTPHAH
jgi:flagellar biosynthesis protein FlhF